MTNTFGRTLFVAVLWIWPLSNCFGQAAVESEPACPVADPTPPSQEERAFCEKDSRSEIKAYCTNLAELLRYAQANPSAGKQCYRNLLANLLAASDLSPEKGVDRFITATAASFATKGAISNALQNAGQARPDRQLSSNNNSSGTTSLVSKAGSAELLSMGLDSGVLTRSANGTTTTLTTNADQIFRLVTGNDPDCTVTCNSLGWFENNILNRTNISASLALSQQSSTTTATSGQASGTTSTPVGQAAIPTGVGKLSGITARYQVMNKFDPRSDKFKTAWGKQVTSLKAQVKAIGDDTDAVVTAMLAHRPFSAAASDRATLIQPIQDSLIDAAVKGSNGEDLIRAFEAFWNQALTSDMTNDPKLAAAVSKAVQDRGIYRQAWFNALDQAVGNLFTFEYDYNRPLNQPVTHDIKIIYGYNFQTMGMLTFNGAVSLYDTVPAAAKYGRLRYGQVSAEYDRTLSGKDKSLQTQLSLAGYWQYQPHPSILNIPAGTVVPGTDIPLANGTQEFVGTAGSLWVTQAKLTIKSSGNVSVPIGVSWSNKTDLLQGSKVGAQIGISYNFASLAGLFGGGN